MEARISHAMIKAVSGEFDLESVIKLSLCRMSMAYPIVCSQRLSSNWRNSLIADIRKIENLDECINLQELNLTGVFDPEFAPPLNDLSYRLCLDTYNSP
jgi:hypothetical protein